MYGWLWRHLSGPTALRALQLILIAVGVVAVCFLWPFPMVAPHLPFDQITVEETP